MREKVETRFWNRIEVDILTIDQCWIWTGALDRDGYGRFCVGKKTFRAHRFAYELLVGPIPEHLTIDHLCRVRHCVNPEHLEPVTNQVNILRGETLAATNASKTHCPKGHELGAGNLVPSSLERGKRKCSSCQHELADESYATVKAARESLGLTCTEYVTRYGRSVAVADAILATGLIGLVDA